VLLLAYLYLGISSVLALVVAIGVAAAPQGSRVELATWGAAGALFWWILLAALVVERILEGGIRLSNRLNGR
jgi:hypothetical protein